MDAEWGDFKVLLALATTRSVAGAARALGVDQSTVSRRLSALEAAVGAKLAIRGRGELRLTPEGFTMVAAAETMANATLAATRSVRTAKETVEGIVRVSVSPGFVPLLMQQLLPPLRASYPLLHVELSGAFNKVDLARGEADIAVRMVRPSEPDLVARKAFDMGWFVYASSAYLEAYSWPESHAALSDHPLVLYAENMHSIAPLRWMESYRGAAHTSRVDNLEIACQAISADAGFAVLPGFMADPMATLVRVFPDAIGVNTGWIAYHETSRDAARIRVVVEALAGFFDGQFNTRATDRSRSRASRQPRPAGCSPRSVPPTKTVLPRTPGAA